MTDIETIVEAETALAGAILVDDRCLARIPRELRDSDFLSESCKTVYMAARALEQRRGHIDPVTVKEWARRHHRTLAPEALADMMEATPHCDGAPDYARIIHEDAIRRTVQQLGNRLASDSSKPLPELIGQGLQILHNISTHAAPKGICFRDVAPEEPKWLIKPYIQIGKGTMIQAEPGTGKTAFVCAVAAAVTTGRGFLGLTVENPGNVLMLSTEDDIGILRTRFEANGGDVNRLFAMASQGGLSFDSPEIEAEVLKLQAKLLIFDPFQAFLGQNVDFHRANETRPVLVRLFEMCQRTGCACILVAHLGKNTVGKSAVTQSLGSVDIPGAMRSILHIARNRNLQGELAAVHVKSNNAAKGKTIAFSITDKGGIDFHELNDWELADLAKSGKEENEALPYEEEPMVMILRDLYNCAGKSAFWSYDDILIVANRLFGCSPFKDAMDMRRRLDAIKAELLSRDGLVLETGQRSNKARGIRLSRYETPEGRQEVMEA